MKRGWYKVLIKSLFSDKTFEVVAFYDDVYDTWHYHSGYLSTRIKKVIGYLGETRA